MEISTADAIRPLRVRPICKKVGPEGFSDEAKKLLWKPKKNTDDAH